MEPKRVSKELQRASNGVERGSRELQDKEKTWQRRFHRIEKHGIYNVFARFSKMKEKVTKNKISWFLSAKLETLQKPCKYHAIWAVHDFYEAPRGAPWSLGCGKKHAKVMEASPKSHFWPSGSGVFLGPHFGDPIWEATWVRHEPFRLHFGVHFGIIFQWFVDRCFGTFFGSLLDPFWTNSGSQNGIKINEKSIQISIKISVGFWSGSWTVFC